MTRATVTCHDCDAEFVIEFDDTAFDYPDFCAFCGQEHDWEDDDDD